MPRLICTVYLPRLISVFQDTDYPLRLEGGASWRQFWWYDSAGRWPSDENDTLGSNVLAIGSLYSCFVCLFDLILYVPVNSFSVMSDGYFTYSCIV